MLGVAAQQLSRHRLRIRRGDAAGAEVHHVALIRAPGGWPTLKWMSLAPAATAFSSICRRDRFVFVGARRHRLTSLSLGVEIVGIMPASSAFRSESRRSALIAGALPSWQGSFSARLRARPGRTSEAPEDRAARFAAGGERDSGDVPHDRPLSPGRFAVHFRPGAETRHPRRGEGNASARYDLPRRLLPGLARRPPAPSRSARRRQIDLISVPCATPEVILRSLAFLFGLRVEARRRSCVQRAFVAPRHEARHKRRLPKVVARRRSRARCIVRDKLTRARSQHKASIALSFVPDVLASHRLGHLT